MKIPQRITDALKRRKAYTLWSSLRGHGQARAYEGVINRYNAYDGSRSKPDADAARMALARHASNRRPFLGSDARPHIVAFGVNQWERHGLWPAFGETSRFSLSVYGAHASAASTPATAQDMGRGFLRAIDDAECVAPVTCAFFYASGSFITSSLLAELKQRGIWSVIMGLDDKHQFYRPQVPGEPHAEQVRVARCCDLYWTTWETGAHIVRELGGTPWFAPEGAHPDFHKRESLERIHDAVFVGAAYGERVSFVSKLRDFGFNVEAFGPGWERGPLSFDEMVATFNRARVVLGIGSVGHLASIKHLKGRDFEVPMCGAAYLTSYNPELAEFFDIGREIGCYGSVYDCADVLADWLSNEGKLENMRAAVHARSLRDHTWGRRLRELYSLFP